jgi:hypothetical protein
MGSNNNNNDWFGPTSDVASELLADVFVRYEGTIFLFEPLTVAAKQWIDENVQPNAQWFGNALVVEHRYAAGLAAAMREAGLVLVCSSFFVQYLTVAQVNDL